jgi:hypothetical protein
MAEETRTYNFQPHPRQEEATRIGEQLVISGRPALNSLILIWKEFGPVSDSSLSLNPASIILYYNSFPYVSMPLVLIKTFCN